MPERVHHSVYIGFYALLVPVLTSMCGICFCIFCNRKNICPMSLHFAAAAAGEMFEIISFRSGH